MSSKQQPEAPATPYGAGYCPKCGEVAHGAERTPDGKVHCVNGHFWKREEGVKKFDANFAKSLMAAQAEGPDSKPVQAAFDVIRQRISTRAHRVHLRGRVVRCGPHEGCALPPADALRGVRRRCHRAVVG